MSAAGDEEKETQKALPLDLARSQISTVRTVDGKAPIVMAAGQSLRGMRVLTQTVSSSGATNVSGPAIITTNIVPQAVLKQDSGRTQIATIITSSSAQGQAQSQVSGNVTIQRPSQITLSTSPVVAQNVATGTTYHVPRGAAVVANLAAPRSNVTTVRAPMVVAAQTALQVHSFVRSPKTPSPTGTAWLTTNPANGSQIKGTPTVLSSPIRGTTVTGKPQLVARAQTPGQNVSTIRPGTILHSAITLGQSGQIHSYKPTQTPSGIQALGSTVTIAQVLPTRTQAVVYNANSSGQFTSTPRLTVTSSTQSTRPAQIQRPMGQVTTARLTIPVSVSPAPTTRTTVPTTTAPTPTGRLSTVSALTVPQPAVLTATGCTPARLVTAAAAPSVAVGRLSVATAQPAQTGNQPRIPTLNLQSLVPVAGSVRSQVQPQQKIIAQGAQGIQLTSLQSNAAKTPQTVATSVTRTISVPSTIVTQRQAVLSSAIPIAKVYQPQAQQVDSQQGAAPSTVPANVFIHNVSSLPKRTSPSQSCASQPTSTTVAATTTIAAYSLRSGTYFYDTNYNRNFSQASSTLSSSQLTTAAVVEQRQQNHIQPISSLTQVHGIVTNQAMRYNPVMVVEQNRNQQQQQYSQSQIIDSGLSEHTLQQSVLPTKLTSSPRPSILRKRDHEGSPIKAAKNLSPLMINLPRQQPTSQSPPSPPSRPDSRGNGNSSGGSTTISATSSPGLAELNEDSLPEVPIKNKEETKTFGVSPRKKPRKQQLTSNELEEHTEDMQFISDGTVKKEVESDDGNQSEDTKDGTESVPPAENTGHVTPHIRKPASASLLNSYKQNWKATHNHYLRYCDVKPKDERRPTIMDLANQAKVQDKVNGWKIHHLSTQMEELAESEQSVYDQLSDLLKCTESVNCSSLDKELNRVNELIKGNLQRIKIINDGMIEAKTQIMKIFDHKIHVSDIIGRCASKRNFKKREKT